MSKINEYTKEIEEGSRPQEPSKIEAVNARAYISSVGSTNGFSSPADGANFLRSFLNATPFFDLYEYVCDHHFSGRNGVVKNNKLKAIHPFFYSFCVWADVCVRLVVVCALITLAVIAAAKIIA